MEKYHEILREKLSEKRYQHSINVSKKAVYLAEKYGADIEKAKIAGLLHDITKQIDETEQLHIISDAGMSLSETEMKNIKLWHAVSGMAFLKARLNINDSDILNAVRYHTTGRANMSLLEKIVFVADMISEDRIFEGVEKVRALAEENLDKAVCFSSILSIEWLIEKKQVIAFNTLNAYNDTVSSFN